MAVWHYHISDQIIFIIYIYKCVSIFILFGLAPCFIFYYSGSYAIAFRPPTLFVYFVTNYVIQKTAKAPFSWVLQWRVLPCGRHQEFVMSQQVKRSATLWTLPFHVFGCVIACEFSMKLYICTIHCTLENHFVLSHASESH